MTRTSWGVSLFAAAVLLAVTAGNAKAVTLISDFSNFGPTGAYVDWVNGTLTAGPNDWRVQSTNSGGAFTQPAPPIQASSEHLLEARFSVNPADVAHVFNVVLFDGDGTQRVFRYRNLAIGNNQTLTRSLLVQNEDTGWLQDNAAGTTAGLDISSIVEWHVQGTFASAAVSDITFDNLVLVPEPMTTALLSVGALMGVGLIRRRRG